MHPFEHISLTLLSLILVGCASVRSDDIQPVAETAKASEQTPDPALLFANANRVDDIPYTEGYFGTGESRVHYVEAGKGPLIIFYHGFPSFWYSWFDQMEVLKANYRVVAVDGLGSGHSAKPTALKPYEIDNLAKLLNDLSLHLGGEEKYILVGHDWGSVLALAYAQAYPNRLHKVVGMSAPPFNLLMKYIAKDKKQQQRAQYMQRFRHTTLEMLKARNAIKSVRVQSYGKLLKTGALSQAEYELFEAALADNETLYSAMNWYRANIPAFEDIKDADLWPGPNSKIEMPGLFLTGDRDTLFAPELIRQVNDAGNDMKTIKILGAGHWISMEKPKQVNKALLEFIQD